VLCDQVANQTKEYAHSKREIIVQQGWPTCLWLGSSTRKFFKLPIDWLEIKSLVQNIITQPFHFYPLPKTLNEKCSFQVSCQFNAKSGVIDQLTLSDRPVDRAWSTCWLPLLYSMGLKLLWGPSEDLQSNPRAAVWLPVVPEGYLWCLRNNGSSWTLLETAY